MHRITAMLAISALIVGGAACSSAMRPVQFEAAAVDWETLSGNWRGQYTVTGQDRHGLIEFRLDALEREAAGDVLMISPRGWPVTGMPPSDVTQRRPHSETQLLSIRFVGADHGLVRGDIEAYWDPDRECRASAAFYGSVDGDMIAGSFVTTCDDGVRILRGRWRVERRAPSQVAVGAAAHGSARAAVQADAERRRTSTSHRYHRFIRRAW
jgi:hypothetical protein